MVKNRSLAEIALSVTYVHRGSELFDYESVQACETERRASPLQVTQPYCWSQDVLRACEGRRPMNDSVHEINCTKYQTRNGLPPGPAPGLPVSETGSGQPREPESRQGPGEQEALAALPGGARVPWRVRCCSCPCPRRRSLAACTLQPPSPARMPARLVLIRVYPIAVGTG